MLDKIILRYGDIHSSAVKIIDQLKGINLHENVEETAIIAIARGGLIPSQLISYGLGIKNVYTIRAGSYSGDNTPSESGFLDINGLYTIPYEKYKNIIVVDDIYDTGKTMQYIINKISALNVTRNTDIIPCVLNFRKNLHPKNIYSIIYGSEIMDSSWLVYPWDNISEEGI